MKYLVACLVAGIAACSSSPAQMSDGGVPDVPNVGAVDPTLSTVVTDRDIVLVGSPPVNVYVTLRDAHDLPIEGANVQLMVTSGSVTTPAATDSVGRTTAVWTNTVTGTYDVALVVDGVTIATHSVDFMPGSATMLTFSQQPTNADAGQMLMPEVTVETVDVGGNFVPVVNGTIDLSLEPNAQSAQLEGNTYFPIDHGKVKFPTLYVRTAGTGYRIRAHMAGVADAVSDSFDIAQGDPDATLSVMSATPTSLQADGIETSSIVVHVQNAFGVPFVGANVALSASGTNNVLSPASGATDMNGDFTATLSSTTAEAKTVTGVVAGLTLTRTVHFFGPSCTPQLPGPPGATLGYYGNSLLVADLDGDGHDDAVVLEAAHPVFYRSRADGTFFPPVAEPAEIAPIHRIKAADMNGDGRPDLLFGIQNATSMGFELNLGGGQFAAPSYPGNLVQTATEFTTGDFNGDGRVDVVVASAQNTVVIALNTGSYPFTTSQTISNVNASDLGVADLNRDGKQDLVITTATGIESLLGNGNGTFGAPLMTAGGGSGRLVIADFNNDGKPDCAVTLPGWTLQPFLGVGNGRFTAVGSAIPTAEYNSSTSGLATIAGARDLDGDGKLDLVVAEGPSVTVLRGGGNGTFSVAHVYAAQALDVGLGEVDSDGVADVVTMQSLLLGVLRGNGDGTFIAPESHAESDDQGGLYGAADFDRDGHTDVLIRTAAGVRALLARPGGTLTDAALAAATETSLDLGAADVTGDGILDAVGIFAASSGVAVRVANGVGDGTFAPFTIFAMPTLDIRGVRFMDLDRDGKQDLALTAAGSGGIWTARSNGDGTFAAPQQIPLAQGAALPVDLDGDGITDLISDYMGSPLFFFGDGMGGLSLGSFNWPLGAYTSFSLGDVDGDGRLDIVTGAYDVVQGSSISVYRGQPGGFGPALVTPHVASYPVGSGGNLADVTGDGALDLVSPSDKGLMVIPGYGDGYFYKTVLHYPMSATTGVSRTTITDLDRNGRSDVVFWKGMGVGVAFNRGCVP